MNSILTLSSDDVEALRRASHVTFIADSKHRAKVRATLEKGDPTDVTKAEARIFPAWDQDLPRERIREVRCEGFVKTSLGIMGGHDPLAESRLVGTHFIMAARYSAQWKTVTRLIKVGAGLELMFLADHATANSHRDAGFHGDEFRIRIWTPDEKHGYLPTYEFLLDTSFAPHNSARMVRAEGDHRQATTFLNIDHYWGDAA